MKTYYCHENFTPGLTCTNKTDDGRCLGGLFCNCSHKSLTPKYRSFTTPPMPSVKPPKKKSTDCSLCVHRDVCELKKKFNEIKKNNYPVICECEKYQSYNPLLEV